VRSSAEKEFPREWVEPVNQILRITEGHDELVTEGISWKMEFMAREGGLDWLAGGDRAFRGGDYCGRRAARLRVCSNPACGLFFSDKSRTHGDVGARWLSGQSA